MAITTQGATLKYNNGASFVKLADIKSFPDMGAAPNLIEVTTLSDTAQQFIEGVKPMAAIEFTANYDATDFATITGLTGTKTYMLDFGTAGAFYWEGAHTAWVVGGGVNAVLDMKINVIPSSVIRTTPTAA
jgi:hypothetical protein